MIHMAEPRATPIIPSVTRNDGITNKVVSRPLTAPTTSPVSNPTRTPASGP